MGNIHLSCFTTKKVYLFSVGVIALHRGRVLTVSIVIEGTVLAHQALKGPKKSMINDIPKLNKNLSIMPFIWIIYFPAREHENGIPIEHVCSKEQTFHMP